MNDSHRQFDRVIRSILSTHPAEIGCDDAYQHVDRLAELRLSGMDPAREMPLVWDHLERCRFCRTEFEALLHVTTQI